LPQKKPTRSTLRKIKLLLLDVDGVMTDGGIYFSETGDELKKFNIQDGYGIIKFQKRGFTVGIITGRISKVVQRRAQELGIVEVYQNLDNKIDAYLQIKTKLNVDDEQIAYIGDDEPDIPVLKRAGLSACPKNAVLSVRTCVDYVCSGSGGEGAVREVIDLILGSHDDAK
jgi:3-deoxy-D-manno-octulosonate 8-phosphate phosphatase (KDO 8-P phosphatase)